MLKDSLKTGLEHCTYYLGHALDEHTRFPDSEPVADLSQALEAIAREVAKLDGFDVELRSLAIDQTSDC
jgi:type I restriction enzyme M protein